MAEEIAVGQEGQEQLHEIKVGGVVQKVTTEKLLEYAQKGAGVLPTLQSEKDKLVKELEQIKADTANKTAFLSDVEKFFKVGDQDAVAKMAKQFGVSVADFRALVAKNAGVSDDEDLDEEELEEEPKPKKSKGRRQSALDEEENVADRLPPDYREAVEYVKKQKLEAMRQQLFNEVDRTLDSDPILGKLSKNAKVAEVLKGLGRQALQRRVVVEGANPGPQVYDAIRQEVRDTVEKMGIRAEAEDAVGNQKRALLAMGLPAEAVSILEPGLHQGNTSTERVSVASNDYRDNFAKRFAQKLARLASRHKREPEDSDES